MPIAPLALYTASVTDSLVTLATHIINDLGLIGIAILNCISQVIIVPGTEATMLFAGFNVDQGHLQLGWVIVFGVLGDVAGGSICYLIGYLGMDEALSHRGLHIDRHRIDQAHGWFERWGLPVVAVSRCIPVLRSAPPYAAGIAKMSYWRFASFATLGSAVWITALALIGKAVGHDWQKWRNHLGYVDYAVVVIVVLAIVWLLVQRVRARRAAKVPS